MLLNGNEQLQQFIMAFMGLSAGGIVAAGIFAFLTMIGIFPRLIGKSNTRRHINLYETMIICGGILGNAVNLFGLPSGWKGLFVLNGVRVGGALLLALFGFFVGVFIACLVMSLAEMLKTIPIFNRRIQLAVGIQYVIFAIALGKMIGSLIYFSHNIGS